MPTTLFSEEKLPDERYEPLLPCQVPHDIHRRKSPIFEFFRALTGKQLITLDYPDPSRNQQTQSSASYGAIKHEGIVIGDEKRQMRLIIKHIGPHRILLAIHYIRRIAEKQIECAQILSEILGKHVGQNEVRNRWG